MDDGIIQLMHVQSNYLIIRKRASEEFISKDNRQADRQIDRQTDRQADRQTDRQTGRQTER